MLNNNPNAIVTLTNLSPDYFIQGDDGTISLKPDMDLSISKTVNYTSGADDHQGYIELVNSTNGATIFSLPVINHYDSIGEYLGSTVATTQGSLA